MGLVERWCRISKLIFSSLLKGNFYALPLDKVLCLMIMLIFIWTYLAVKFNMGKYKEHRIWRIVNITLCLLAFCLIIKKTLWGREVGQREIELIPFYTLTTIPCNDEAIRTMVMNVILFLPFGLTIPYVLEGRIKNGRCKWLMGVLTGAVFSIMIESLQYYFGIGRAETDDVICNTLGCALGVLADMLTNVFRKY